MKRSRRICTTDLQAEVISTFVLTHAMSGPDISSAQATFPSHRKSVSFTHI